MAGEATAYGWAQAARTLERVRPARSPGRVQPARSLQLALGAMWLLDGALQCQPFMFRRTFAIQIVAPNAAGQPAIVGEPILWMAHEVASHAVLFNVFAASIQMLIGLGLILRRTVKVALFASFAWAVGVWWFGEGLGMLLTGDASPLTGAPGAVLLYAVLGMILWPVGRSGSVRPPGGRTGSGGGHARPEVFAVSGGHARPDVLAVSGGLLGPAGARLAWAALWVLGAGLWLAPVNRGANSTASAIAAAPSGSSWLTGVQHAAAGAAAGRGAAIAVVLATLSAAIAIAVLLEWHPRPFLALACLISLACWVLGQGLGGILTGSATDLNAGPLLMLLAAAMWFMPRSPARRPQSEAPGGVARAYPRGGSARIAQFARFVDLQDRSARCLADFRL